MATSTTSKHQWRTILLCMGGATLFWLLNALNKVYTTDIKYPVHFVIDESKVAFTEVPPTSVALEVTGGGWRLLRYLLRLDVQPIALPVARVARRGRVQRKYLLALFDKKIKDLKVHRVLLDEAPAVHKLPQNSPGD